VSFNINFIHNIEKTIAIKLNNEANKTQLFSIIKNHNINHPRHTIDENILYL